VVQACCAEELAEREGIFWRRDELWGVDVPSGGALEDCSLHTQQLAFPEEVVSGGEVHAAWAEVSGDVGGWVGWCTVAEDPPESSCVGPFHLLEVFGEGEGWRGEGKLSLPLFHELYLRLRE